MKTAKILLLIAGLTLILSLLAGCEGNSKGETALQRCGIAPQTKESAKKDQDKDENKDQSGMPDIQSFTAQTLDGGTFNEKDLAGHDITMINIWQTTCGPCIEEMPQLAKLAASMPDHVLIATWCLDGDADVETTEKIMDNAGFKGPTLLSGDGDLEELMKELMYTPTTVIVDSGGHMIGEPLIGSPEDPKKTYTDCINRALKELGKETL